ncbi:hypothetical protein HOR30_gp10 [Klebsiella phage KP-Rio/2015]|uniref:Uncharacterized protein n=1 Tax=Klebsiella phage KP-Rio/2015 TaxID=1904925 RepID=A0A1D8ES00_9CAUD|nr:hypothetical protein HOR30_gp10 [Klebsiella phage KP-Rio/2015]AOT23849.1 hypothetical protein KPRIO2015_10 [Klebsiella phage KP-Rio/2015]
MSKFKVGDKVVRKAHENTSSFKAYQGDFAYCVITDITTSGHWLQLDNVTDGGADPYPWYADNFELYQEPEDEELPPVQASVTYMNSKRDSGNDQRLVLEKDNGSGEGLMYIGVIPRKGSTRAQEEIGINIDPDSALQLAHDLRRMAMDIKRKGKAQ